MYRIIVALLMRLYRHTNERNILICYHFIIRFNINMIFGNTRIDSHEKVKSLTK